MTSGSKPSHTPAWSLLKWGERPQVVAATLSEFRSAMAVNGETIEQPTAVTRRRYTFAVPGRRRGLIPQQAQELM
jgi:hypothetical protein